jgi:pimeloyl-ACP methyl ester carboxylesterase
MLLAWAKQYERDGQIHDEVLYPPPGRLIQARGTRVHVYERGESGPAVVLDAGIAASSLSWRLVDDRIAEFARVYSYDRPGYGWSDRRPGAKVARGLVEEMREVMAAAGAPLPRILVGHSFGGMMMRLYAAMHPQEVAGVVLVDALTPEEWFPLDERRTAYLRHASKMARRAAWLSERGLVRWGLRAALNGNSKMKGLARAVAGPGGQGMLDSLLGQLRKLPVETWPQIRSHWSRPTSFETVAEYFADLPASCAQAHLASDLGTVPLIVLAGQENKPGHAGRQARMAKLSRNGDYRQIHGAGHWLMLDAPDAVVDAVRDLASSK